MTRFQHITKSIFLHSTKLFWRSRTRVTLLCFLLWFSTQLSKKESSPQVSATQLELHQTAGPARSAAKVGEVDSAFSKSNKNYAKLKHVTQKVNFDKQLDLEIRILIDKIEKAFVTKKINVKPLPTARLLCGLWMKFPKQVQNMSRISNHYGIIFCRYSYSILTFACVQKLWKFPEKVLKIHFLDGVASSSEWKKVSLKTRNTINELMSRRCICNNHHERTGPWWQILLLVLELRPLERHKTKRDKLEHHADDDSLQV